MSFRYCMSNASSAIFLRRSRSSFRLRHQPLLGQTSAAAAPPPTTTATTTTTISITHRRSLSAQPALAHDDSIFEDNHAHPSTAKSLASDARYLLPLYARPDVIFTHGEGCYLVDQVGRRFLDLAAGIAVNALGHADKDVVALVAEQAGQMIHLSNLYHHEHAGPFAKALVEALPEGCQGGIQGQGTKVFFCNSGTEANEAAIKFGRKHGRTHARPDTPKHTIVSFTNAFHGRSMGSLSATPSPKYQTPFMPLLPGFVNAPYNDVEQIAKVVDESVCAVLVEPVQGEGGIVPATKEFLVALRKRCDEVGALLIFDEIQCGLGRTGTLFAYEQYGVSPDILTLAKPLANGLPIGAVLIAPNVASTISPGDHGTTFGGSPLATRVGHAVLDRINTPAFLSHVKDMGAHLLEQCKELADNSPIISAVRGSGLMVGMQLRDKVDPNMFVELARERGVLVISAGQNTVRIVPPLVITKEQLDHAVEVFDQVIGEMESYIASGKDLQT